MSTLIRLLTNVSSRLFITKAPIVAEKHKIRWDAAVVPSIRDDGHAHLGQVLGHASSGFVGVVDLSPLGFTVGDRFLTYSPPADINPPKYFEGPEGTEAGGEGHFCGKYWRYILTVLNKRVISKGALGHLKLKCRMKLVILSLHQTNAL